MSHEQEANPASEFLAARQEAMARMWAVAYRRIGALEYPDDGRAILARFSPSLLAAWDEREGLAEALSVAFVAEQSQQAALEAALAAWEVAVYEAIRNLARICHGCGRVDAVAMVTTDYAARYCARCLVDGAIHLPGRRR